MNIMVSQITAWLFNQQLVQANIKENIKASHYLQFQRESGGGQKIPHKKEASNVETFPYHDIIMRWYMGNFCEYMYKLNDTFVLLCSIWYHVILGYACRFYCTDIGNVHASYIYPNNYIL